MEYSRYTRVDTINKLIELDDFLMDGDKPRYDLMSYDTETNGKLLYRSVVVGFSLAVNRNQGFYIPILEWKRDLTSLKTRKIKGKVYQSYMRGCLRDIWTDKEYSEFVTPQEYSPPKEVIIYLNKWLKAYTLVELNAPFDTNMTYINCGIESKDNVLCDVGLMHHVLNENSLNGLKDIALEWKEELGLNPFVAANIEQQELVTSIIENGGNKKHEVWRADPWYQAKYGCSDATLTYGEFEVGMGKFYEEFGEDKIAWFFEDEIMPLCKIVTMMKRNGVYLDVEHFKKLEIETSQMMNDLEDKLMLKISPLLADFTLGKSLDESVSNQRLIKKIAELENLELPKNGKSGKETLAKSDVKKEYDKNPHWLWAYVLGEDEIKYSQDKLNKVKQDLYCEIEERRYRFNISSKDHLRWLFCDKLGIDKTTLPQTDSATKENPIPSMDAEVMKEHILPKFPWVMDLMIYNKLSKLYSAYILPAIKLSIESWLTVDWKQSGTVSGRFSCSGGFNLQTLPRAEEASNCCSKCESEDIDIVNPIELLMTKTCKSCGFIEENVVQPSAIKKGFIAPQGYKLVNADFSALEPRCFAYMSGDKKLKEVFIRQLDLYSKVYCDMFDKKHQYSADPNAENYLKKVNNAERVKIKPLVLGIPYGAQEGQVCHMMGLHEEDGTPLWEEGRMIIDLYLQTYPDLRKYMNKCESDCIEKGTVETLIGRKRHFEFAPYVSKNITGRSITTDNEEAVKMRKTLFEKFIDTPSSKLSDPNVKISKTMVELKEEDLKEIAKKFGIDYAEIAKHGYWSFIKNLSKQEYNNSKNFGIQGLAAHLTNMGMIEIDRLLKENNIEGFITLTVHDEITLLVREDQAELAAKLLQQGMEHNKYTALLDIPMEAKPIICDNLKESK